MHPNYCQITIILHVCVGLCVHLCVRVCVCVLVGVRVHAVERAYLDKKVSKNFGYGKVSTGHHYVSPFTLIGSLR